MQRKPFSWVTLVAIGLAGVIAVSATTALAVRSAASPFELTAEFRTEKPWWEYPTWWEYPSRPHEGTFAARAPFCRSGAVVVASVSASETRHRFTCDDGSGGLVVSIAESPFTPFDTTNWRILDGTGSYVGLRGTGSARSEVLEDPNGIVTWRSTLEGVAAEDAIAPTIGFSSIEVTKLPRPAGAYSLDVTIALRDDDEGSPVSYLLRVTPTASARELARSSGTAQAGAVSTTMRVRYYKPPRRSVLLRLSASDEVGNETSLDQMLKLPR